MIKRGEMSGLPATDPKPGDYDLGSLESRAAARTMLLKGSRNRCRVIVTKMGRPLNLERSNCCRSFWPDVTVFRARRARWQRCGSQCSPVGGFHSQVPHRREKAQPPRGCSMRSVKPNPGDFPIGSVESRVAARAELERRGNATLQGATVVIMTGLPFLHDHAPATTSPDFDEYYQAADGSIVWVTHRFWEGDGRSGLTVFIEQLWPNGETYRGTCGVKSLAELERLPRMDRSLAERILWG